MLCPARVERALNQAIYLRHLDLSQCTDQRGSDQNKDDDNDDCAALYHVEGTSMSVYTVQVSRRHAKCTCPDFCTRATTCKHIIFVLARVHKLNVTMRSMKELLQAHWALVTTAQGAGMCNDACDARALLTLEGDCCVCLDTLAHPVWTCATCKNNLHTACMQQWRRGCRGQVSCPLCRSPL